MNVDLVYMSFAPQFQKINCCIGDRVRLDKIVRVDVRPHMGDEFGSGPGLKLRADEYHPQDPLPVLQIQPVSVRRCTSFDLPDDLRLPHRVGGAHHYRSGNSVFSKLW